LRDKIGLFCNIAGEDVIQNVDADSLYEVPLLLEAEGLGSRVCKRLGLANGNADLEQWRAMVERGKHLDKKARIALVGKYVELRDAYFSLTEALSHAGNALGAAVEIDWIPSSSLENCPDADAILSKADGIIVPGGFGERGAEGKVRAAGYARENNIPFYGINMGMQMAIVEFARSVLGLSDANSTEHAPDTGNPVVDLLSEKKEMGDTMRLGTYRCTLAEGSRAHAAYGALEVNERHRHRYEINEDYVEPLTQNGMVVTGRSEHGLVEIVEIPSHPWYVGVQFNAEFRSRPNKAHPLIVAFVEAALKAQN
jgi:CTP synthase